MQARHGKKKRLEQTLTLGFNIESEDESGNTLLLVAVQQLQVKTGEKGPIQFLRKKRDFAENPDVGL